MRGEIEGDGCVPLLSIHSSSPKMKISETVQVRQDRVASLRTRDLVVSSSQSWVAQVKHREKQIAHSCPLDLIPPPNPHSQDRQDKPEVCWDSVPSSKTRPQGRAAPDTC